MKKKVLFVATVAKGHIQVFHLPFMKAFQEAGYEVHIAARNDFENPDDCRLPYCDVYYDLPFERMPLRLKNFECYRFLKTLIERERFEIVHCHTPVAAMCARLACRGARKRGTKVFYTAHGFHFYKGAPLKNWLLYYPVEKICSRWTDLLITINQEDYALAQRRMKAQQVVYVPGVGVDLTKFGNATVDRAAKRRELGVPEDATLLLSVGELNANKNHETVIRALAELAKSENVYYAIAGRGDWQERLQNCANSLGWGDRVKLLGFRRDVAELYAASDVFVFPSFREGLSVSVMEAMAGGLPCVLSRIRGNVDLIDENGGVLFDPHSVDDCRKALASLLEGGVEKMRELGAYNAEKVKAFGLEPVLEQMTALYRSVVDAT